MDSINTEHTGDVKQSGDSLPDIVNETETLSNKDDFIKNGTCEWTWLGLVLGLYANDLSVGEGDGHVAMEMEEQEKVDEDDDVPSFAEFKKKMIDQGTYVCICGYLSLDDHLGSLYFTSLCVCVNHLAYPFR